MYPIVGLTRFVREEGVSPRHARVLYRRARALIGQDDVFGREALPRIFGRNKRLAGRFMHAVETSSYQCEAARLRQAVGLWQHELVAVAMRERKVATLN